MFESTAAGKKDRNWLWLKISPGVQKAAWQEARDHSNSRASYNAYVNRACLASFMEWLADWLDEEETKNISAKTTIWPTEDIAAILEVVNGTAVRVGEARMVLIPRDETDAEKLCVPQEWVDTPWAADYYLSIRASLEMDEEDCWMSVCGFATHRQLKQEAEYSSAKRAYILSEDALIHELAAMQITLGMRMRSPIPPLPVLAAAKAKQLLRKLGDAAIYSPRLRSDVPFEQWAALLVDSKSREELHDRRMDRFREQTAAIALRQWLDNIDKAAQNLAAKGWLPIVCQNPLVPPTWADLGGAGSGAREQNRIIPFWPVKPQWIFGALLTSAIAYFYAAPKVAVLANDLGHSQRRAGQLYNTRFFYNIATRLNPAKGIYFYNLGLLCDDDLGDRLCAIQNYERGAMLGNAESMAELARLQIAGDRQEIALKTVRRCLDQAEYDGVKASCQKNLAWIRWQQGRLPEAEENLRQAIALREDSPHAHCLLALVLEARSQEKEALVAWQNSLQYSWGNIHIPEQDRCIGYAKERWQ